MTPPRQPENREGSPENEIYYCPRCAEPVSDPLVCGDCLSIICRKCGAPLENTADLGIG